MNNKNFKLLNDWLLSLNLNERKEARFEDIHIDELIGEKIKTNKMMFFKGLELFYDFIHLSFDYDIHLNYVPSLYFHLECTSSISLNIKNDIWDEFSRTPPEICLAPKERFLSPIEVEEYKKPLDLDVFEKFREDCSVYYSCYRNIEYIKNNWNEYSRVICMENFGKEQNI